VRSDLVVPLGSMSKSATPPHLVARDALPETVLHAELVIRMARG
jgi:hypothetical protein